MKLRDNVQMCALEISYSSDWSLMLHWERVNRFMVGEEYKGLWSHPGLVLSPGCV